MGFPGSYIQNQFSFYVFKYPIFKLFTLKLKCSITFNIFLMSSIAKKLPKNVNRHGVFAANELDLDEVEVYG